MARVCIAALWHGMFGAAAFVCVAAFIWHGMFGAATAGESRGGTWFTFAASRRMSGPRIAWHGRVGGRRMSGRRMAWHDVHECWHGLGVRGSLYGMAWALSCAWQPVCVAAIMAS